MECGIENGAAEGKLEVEAIVGMENVLVVAVFADISGVSVVFS